MTGLAEGLDRSNGVGDTWQYVNVTTTIGGPRTDAVGAGGSHGDAVPMVRQMVALVHRCVRLGVSSACVYPRAMSGVARAA